MAQNVAMNEHPELETYRAQFPLIQNKSYLNSCSLGALSTRSINAMNQFMDLWSEWGASAWYEIWMGEIAKLKASFAKLINAKPHEIAILPSVSAALSSVASAFDYKERNKVITTELDFPTVPYQWMVKKRLGVEVQFLSSPDQIQVPLEQYKKMIDSKTIMVATSRVFFTSGYIQDVKSITEMAHAKGAYMLVDDYQGTGQIPIDVKKMNVDFLVTGGLKWLLGGMGIVFLYVREDLIQKLEPTITGWFANEHQFDFNPKDFEYRRDASRFELGTPALAPVYAASGGLSIVNEIGSPKIRERTLFLTHDLITKAQEHGFKLRVAEREEERAAIVIIPMEKPQPIVKALSQRNFIIDYRPGALRLSPYFYNAPDENDAVLDEIKKIRAAL
ncbi:aminotransferase class V-fold PLP-dependent enzyme [Candidatus Acetothermia bacterium]|nr:aminotransferase class V-fold PLP-dependent enzyme [Candidatus Acetothermia bacterium]MBI3642841.1 aminotransferase class V-fold PLP-dependent enzyme [Candidatus Acetothermia bacterium]